MTSTDREEERETVRNGAVSAWNDYRANGVHATHSAADAWLAELEAGNDVEPPECHA